MGILSYTKTGKHAIYTEFPSTTNELIDSIERAIDKYGYTCSLNHIDVSKIIDFDYLFEKFKSFNGDISKWNVSNARSMFKMFYGTEFNNDISNWNVSKVEDMTKMFGFSKFKGDISKWDVSNVKDMSGMFSYSVFNNDISNWNVSNVINMNGMFLNSDFNGDISKWKINSSCRTINIFYECRIRDEYKPKNNKIMI